MDCQDDLRRRLAVPGHPKVRNLETGEMVPAAALLLSCRGMDFTYNCTAKAVQWVRPIFKTPVREKCYRTEHACMIPVSPEYGQANLGRTVEL